MVMMPEALPEENYDNVPDFPKKAESLFADALNETSLNGNTMTFGLDELEAAISKHEKHPVYDRKPCPNQKCSEGSVECVACGKWSDCDVCGGTGDIRGENIIGHEFYGHAEVKIGALFYAANYVDRVLGGIMRLIDSNAILLAQQSYDDIDKGKKEHGTCFKIGDVDFSFMPMRKHGNNEMMSNGAEIQITKLR
jgi:hypothetical protein